MRFNNTTRGAARLCLVGIIDPGETSNLYYQADYREQLRQQLSLMQEHAKNLRDELAIKLAHRELAIIDEPDYKYNLY